MPLFYFGSLRIPWQKSSENQKFPTMVGGVVILIVEIFKFVRILKSVFQNFLPKFIPHIKSLAQPSAKYVAKNVPRWKMFPVVITLFSSRKVNASAASAPRTSATVPQLPANGRFPALSSPVRDRALHFVFCSYPYSYLYSLLVPSHTRASYSCVHTLKYFTSCFVLVLVPPFEPSCTRTSCSYLQIRHISYS